MPTSHQLLERNTKEVSSETCSPEDPGVNKIAYESLNAIVREAIANPYKIWTSLNGLCIQCGKQSTYACSHCGKVYYCSEACETA